MIRHQHFSPGQHVCETLALGLFDDPQLKVADSVVVLDAVDVVNVFVGQQLATKVLFHDEPVFQDSVGSTIGRESQNSVAVGIHETDSFFIADPLISTVRGTVGQVLVVRELEQVSAMPARPFGGSLFGFPFASAGKRAMLASRLGVGRFGEIFFAAIQAIFEYRGLSDYSALSKVMTAWHEISSGWLKCNFRASNAFAT